VWLKLRCNRVHRAHDDDDDMYDDDAELDDKYIENEHQAEEFGMEILGATKAIDVGSILGTDVFSSDVLNEYDSDDQQRLSVTPFSSFAARKSNLLEYTVLLVAELNTLMEHKHLSSSLVEKNGDASSYVSKIDRPLNEFAAIFRLEGVLVDASGLQFEAWKNQQRMQKLHTKRFK